MGGDKKHLDGFYKQTAFGHPHDIRYTCLICGREGIRHDCGRTQHLKKMHPSEYRAAKLVEQNGHNAQQANTAICPTCEGHGSVSKPPFDDSWQCPECKGTGKQHL